MILVLKTFVLITLVISICFAIHLIPSRKLPAVKFLLINMATYGFWAICLILTLFAHDFETKSFFTQVRQVAIPFVPVIQFLMIYYVFFRLTPRWYRLLYFIPIVTSLTSLGAVLGFNIFQNKVMANLMVDPTGSGLLIYTPGPILKIQFIYALFLFLSSFYIYLTHLKSEEKRAREYALTFIIASLIIGPFDIYAQLIGDRLMSQFMVISGTVIAVIVYYAIKKYEFLDIRPLAQESVLDALPHPVLAFTPRGDLWASNKQARSIFNISKKEIGKKSLQHFPLLNEGREDFIKYDGASFQVARHELEIPMHDKPATILILSDVTELREQNELLEEVNSQLHHKTVFQKKVQSVISHDLVGNLTGLDMALQTALNDQTPLKEDSLHVIRETNLSTMNLLKDLLLLSEEKESEFCLYTSIENILQHLSAQIKNKNVQIECSLENEERTMKGSRTRFEAVMRNILSNAIKFSPDYGVIRITHQMDDEFHYFKVRDHGPGMRPEKIQHILSGTLNTGEKGGYGLGIKLTQQFLQKLNGSLEIYSAPFEGTEVIVKLKKS